MNKKLIAHRGNIFGPNPMRENSPDYIREASKNYYVEIDVWKIGNKFMLGHDEPTYEVEQLFLLNDKFFLHAKNLEAAHEFATTDYKGNHIYPEWFFHDIDACVLTSKMNIWTYPGQAILSNKAIAVMPERIKTFYDISKAGGICSDYISIYK